MARRSALSAVLLLVPSLAVAQANPSSGKVTVVHSADPNQNPPIINIAQCDGDTADTLTYYFNPTLPGPFKLYISDRPTTNSTPAECPPASAGGNNVTPTSIPINTSIPAGTTNFKDSQNVQARLNGIGVACDTSKTVYFCLVAADAPTSIAATGSLELDLAKPPTPTDVSVMPGDTVLHVSWKEGTSGGNGTTSGYRVFWGASGGTLSSSHDLTSAGTTSYDIGGLTNNKDYDVQVAALTNGKNESDRSAIVPGKPIPILDFWRLYKQDGGREQGGCASGEAGLAALLALVPLALRRRRS